MLRSRNTESGVALPASTDSDFWAAKTKNESDALLERVCHVTVPRVGLSWFGWRCLFRRLHLNCFLNVCLAFCAIPALFCPRSVQICAQVQMGFCRRCGDIVVGPRCKCGGSSVGAYASTESPPTDTNIYRSPSSEMVSRRW